VVEYKKGLKDGSPGTLVSLCGGYNHPPALSGSGQWLLRRWALRMRENIAVHNRLQRTAALMPAVGCLKPKFDFHGNRSDTKAVKNAHN